MKELDIIVVLTHGTHAEEFYNKLFIEESKLRNTRLIYFIPINDGYKIQRKYSQFVDRKHPSEEGQHFPAFILGDIKFEDFLHKPEIRFLDDPKPDNIALIVDDYRECGTTIRYTVGDLKKLGYKEENIFSYIYLLRYPYFNSRSENIAPSKFWKQLG